MDVQALDLCFGCPGRRATREAHPIADRPDDGGPWRRPDGSAEAAREVWPYGYTASSIAAGLGALLWSTLNIPE